MSLMIFTVINAMFIMAIGNINIGRLLKVSPAIKIAPKDILCKTSTNSIKYLLSNILNYPFRLVIIMTEESIFKSPEFVEMAKMPFFKFNCL